MYDVAVPAYFTTLTHIKQIQLKLFYLIIYYFLTLKFHGKVIDNQRGDKGTDNKGAIR